MMLTMAFGFGTLAQSQIKGTVRDSNGTALPYVNIFIENSYTGTTSNTEGYYEIDVSKTGDCAVVFQFLGFRTQIKNIKIEKTFEVIENHLTRTKDWVDNTNEENLPSFESISRRLESKLVEKLAGDLEQDILTVASSDSFLTKLKCKRIISNKNINSIYDFSEIGPYLDESLITVFENSSQNI